MKLEYIVNIKDKYKTIRNVLLHEYNFSHRLMTTLKKENSICLNNKQVYVDKEISAGDLITIDLSYEEDNSNIIPTKMPLNIIYEDDWYMVVNKQAGIPVHPSMLHYEDSLSNGLKYYFDKNSLKKKIRPVNRLDKDTSGLVIFAKNEYIQEQLIRQMKDNSFIK